MPETKFDRVKAAVARRIADPRLGAIPQKPLPVEKAANKIAPLCPGGFMGALKRKPFEHRVTIAIPHLDTIEHLKLGIAMWRHQTIKPYFCVVDTGSPWPVVEQLEKEVVADDVEVHYIRAHGYRHSSEPVTAALDLAHTRCDTEHLFHTHTDVFPVRRDFLEFLLQKCNHAAPVVGWQMSQRAPIRGSTTTHEWRECVSHTATMLHMPAVRRARLTWAMEAYYAHRPKERGPTLGWPDTESPFMLACKAAEITPVLLGAELNTAHVVFADGKDWAVHARSYPSLKMAGNPSNDRWVKAQKYAEQIEAEARARLKNWNDPLYCTNRLEVKGIVECSSCTGTVKLNVFGCKKFESGCVISKTVPGYATCSGCQKQER